MSLTTADRLIDWLADEVKAERMQFQRADTIDAARIVWKALCDKFETPRSLAWSLSQMLREDRDARHEIDWDDFVDLRAVFAESDAGDEDTATAATTQGKLEPSLSFILCSSVA